MIHQIGHCYLPAYEYARVLQPFVPRSCRAVTKRLYALNTDELRLSYMSASSCVLSAQARKEKQISIRFSCGRLKHIAKKEDEQQRMQKQKRLAKTAKLLRLIGQQLHPHSYFHSQSQPHNPTIQVRRNSAASRNATLPIESRLDRSAECTRSLFACTQNSMTISHPGHGSHAGYGRSAKKR